MTAAAAAERGLITGFGPFAQLHAANFFKKNDL